MCYKLCLPNLKVASSRSTIFLYSAAPHSKCSGKLSNWDTKTATGEVWHSQLLLWHSHNQDIRWATVPSCWRGKPYSFGHLWTTRDATISYWRGIAIYHKELSIIIIFPSGTLWLVVWHTVDHRHPSHYRYVHVYCVYWVLAWYFHMQQHEQRLMNVKYVPASLHFSARGE